MTSPPPQSSRHMMRRLVRFYLYLAVFRREEAKRDERFGERVDYALLVKGQHSTHGVIIDPPVTDDELRLAKEGHVFRSATDAGHFALTAFDTVMCVKLVCLLSLGEIVDSKQFFAHIDKLMESMHSDNEAKEVIQSEESCFTISHSAEDMTTAITSLMRAQGESIAAGRPIMAANSVLDNQIIAHRTSRLGTIYLDLDDKVKERSAKRGEPQRRRRTSLLGLPERAVPIPPGKSLPVATYDLTCEDDVTLAKPTFKQAAVEKLFGGLRLRKLVNTVVTQYGRRDRPAASSAIVAKPTLFMGKP